ncbi:class I SAM-dependent methyltransferase [Litchfieldia salsa]|uniref:16S rRNA m(2)G 1207 methyltransferase n=1 Tax=Litchfieldia salsa TaxID=930152 RepID=A0A1H0WUS3_9BACI|nr:class I SAM-dependent methyltransferase [Litchfieldia salsa]SDP94461.1 16S rRNA m(2)G 1207 methyltransferase [Litchfieldia salsa]
MSDHYYTSQPSVASNPMRWSFELRNQSFQFTSDRGVFSKKEVDFGSKLLIETFQLTEVQGSLLDVGCGYGPIGLTLAKVYDERTVEMIDVNERAIALAKENALINEVENVLIYKSDLFANVENKSFAAIVSNPPIRAGKKVVHEILTEGYERLAIGGELWIVIQKKQGAPSAIEKLETMFSDVEVVLKKKGYYIIKSKKG